DQSVTALDLGTFRVVRRLTLPFRPEQLASRPSSRELWVLDEDASRIRVMPFPDLETSVEIHLTARIPKPRAADGKHQPVYKARGVRASTLTYPVKKLTFSSDGR